MSKNKRNTKLVLRKLATMAAMGTMMAAPLAPAVNVLAGALPTSQGIAPTTMTDILRFDGDANVFTSGTLYARSLGEGLQTSLLSQLVNSRAMNGSIAITMTNSTIANMPEILDALNMPLVELQDGIEVVVVTNTGGSPATVTVNYPITFSSDFVFTAGPSVVVDYATAESVLRDYVVSSVTGQTANFDVMKSYILENSGAQVTVDDIPVSLGDIAAALGEEIELGFELGGEFDLAFGDLATQAKDLIDAANIPVLTPGASDEDQEQWTAGVNAVTQKLLALFGQYPMSGTIHIFENGLPHGETIKGLLDDEAYQGIEVSLGQPAVEAPTITASETATTTQDELDSAEEKSDFLVALFAATSSDDSDVTATLAEEANEDGTFTVTFSAEGAEDVTSLLTVTQIHELTAAFSAHLEGTGDDSANPVLGGYSNIGGLGDIIGTTGQARRLEQLTLAGIYNGVDNSPFQFNVSAHLQGSGDVVGTPNPDGSITVGTTGEARRMEGLSISLAGDMAATHSVVYRTHLASTGWTDWSFDGGFSGTRGQARRLEAVEIHIVRRINVPTPSQAMIEQAIAALD